MRYAIVTGLIASATLWARNHRRLEAAAAAAGQADAKTAAVTAGALTPEAGY